MLYVVEISDTQIKPIKDNRFVYKIFVDGLRVINLFYCIWMHFKLHSLVQ